MELSEELTGKLLVSVDFTIHRGTSWGTCSHSPVPVILENWVPGSDRSCGSSPWEVQKATIQARLLSGRARLEALTSHWVPWNREGLCTLPGCWGTPATHKGTLSYFLLSCPSLTSTRLLLEDYQRKFLQANPNLKQLVSDSLQSDPVQFWLDCSTMTPIVRATQLEGEVVLFTLFKLTRNYCHTLYKKRCDMLK